MTKSKKAPMFADMSAFLKSSTGDWNCSKEGQTTNKPQENMYSKVILAVILAGVKEFRWRLRQWLNHHSQHQLVIDGCFANRLSIGDQENRYTPKNLIASAF